MRATIMSPKGANIWCRSFSVTAEDMFPTNTVEVGGCEGAVDVDEDFAPWSALEEFLVPLGLQGAAETDKT